MEWPNELLCSHCDVLILSSGSFRAKDTALSVVEEIYYPNSINTGLLYLIFKNLDNPQIIYGSGVYILSTCNDAFLQFCIAIVRTLMVATGAVECGYPWQNCLGTFIFIEAPFLILFLDFYLKSYSKPSKAKASSKLEQTNGQIANGNTKKID